MVFSAIWSRDGRERRKPPLRPQSSLVFSFLRATDEIRQIEPKQIMTFDHIRIALFDERGESLERVALRFLNVFWIDNDQFFPAGVIRDCNAHDVIAVDASEISVPRPTHDSTSSCIRFNSSNGRSLNNVRPVAVR